MSVGYDPKEKEFNFKHGHGRLNSGINVSNNQVCEKPVESQKSGIDECLRHLNCISQSNARESESDGSAKHLIDMYPEINPDFEDPSMVIPVKDSDPLTTLLSLQLILLACGAFATGMSDSQISFQLGFVSQFLASCASLGFASQQLVAEFPGTLYKFKKFLGIGDIDSRFTRKVVCPDPSCCKLYDFHECYTEDRYGNRNTKTCRGEIYKNGKFHHYCDQPLLKSTYSALGNRQLKPRKEFLIRSIADQIEEKLKRKGMEEACQRWKKEKCAINVRKDIHTGNAWKMLQHEYNYFATNHELALQYNIDWWQPHENSNKSLGVMYFAICNLPREIRYKRENLIIGGVIPSLDFFDGTSTRTEPESLETFQDIIVDELITLWKGTRIETFDHPNGVNMRAALLLNSSDCPAARKSSGFLAVSANHGCSHCLKTFPGKVGKKYYGGFYDSWPARSMEEHR